MRKILLACAACVVFCTQARSAEIIFRAGDLPADAVIYWRIEKPAGAPLAVRSDGREAALELASGAATVLREAFIVDWDRRTFARQVQRYSVQVVADAQPEPTPEPTPTPTPTPTPDDLAQAVLTLARSFDDAQTAQLYAGNFRDVIAQIDAGKIATPAAAARAIVEKNKSISGRVSWKALGELLQQKLDAAKNIAEVRQIFAAVARGLEQVTPNGA